MKETKSYELTNPQKSIWYMEEYYKGTAINNICGSLTISEEINFEKFIQAIKIFVKQNKSFSIQLTLEEGTPKQYFSNVKDFNIENIELNSQDDIQKLEEKMVNTPFNTIDSLLFEFKVFKLPNGSGGFVVNCHHLISDACTFALIGNEIAKIYYNLLNNIVEEYDFPTYLDYINSENEYLVSDKFKKDQEYWTNQFLTIPDVASIPASFKNVSNYSANSKRASFVLQKNTVEKIRTYCSKNKISVFNFFMAVYSLYISRVSNLDDIVIGTPILNRTNFKEKSTTGMFISNVPLKISINNNSTFLEHVSKIAKDSLSMLRHQKYPYQFLLENLRKQNSSVPNLYDNLISYQITKANDGSVDLPYRVHWTSPDYISCSMNIHLHDNNDTGDLIMSYDYLVDKYSLDDISATNDRILTIINQILTNEYICLNNIEIVTEKEKNKILFDFNNTNVDYPKDKTIVDLFEEQVEKTPDKIALISNNIKLTYKELNSLSNKLAYKLLDLGITNKSVVGIMVNRSPEMIIGILAILKSGSTYLPIDPEYPKDRIYYMLENSNSQIILVNELSKNYINDNIKKIDISFSTIKELDYKEINLNKKINSNNLIYIIYTSGSTGNPKGVMISHRNLHNFIIGTKKNIDFSTNKVMVSLTTICFDIFALEVWCSLTSGLTLVLANEKEQNITSLLNKLCIDNNVNMVQTTPSRFSKLIEDTNNLKFLESITDIMIGGEPLPKKLLDFFLSLKNKNIFNMYGPTETTVWSTIKKISTSTNITIGSPIANTTCYILDKNLNLLPNNVPGILYIGGDGVSNGYYNNNILTNEKFIKSPFKNNSILYNTNDLACWLPNGEIIHLGRNDYQIKLNGYRIELGEIENALSFYKDIDKSAVICDTSTKKLYAFYTSKSNINTADLKLFLLSKLPAYMIPYQFIKIENFLYTPNGKLDRKALSIPNDIKIKKDIVTPKTNTEKKLFEIIKNIIKDDKFSLSDDFFTLGMDSINLLVLSMKIEDIFNKNISIQQLLSCTSIIDLSKLIDSSENTKNNITIYNSNINKDYYPTSSAQKRIYYSSIISGDNSTLYNLPGGIIFNKLIDINKLEKCFNILIQKHESFRTYFEIVDGEVVQKIEGKLDFKLKIVNANYNDLKQCFEKFLKPFNLKKAPLFRAELIKFENNKCLLLFDMHHIISDGTSLNILIKDLCSLYNGQNIDEPLLNYKDFAIWENDNLKKDTFFKNKEYWINKFKDNLPILNLPTDYPRPTKKSFKGKKIYKTLDKDITKNINDLAKKLEVTPYMLLLSIYYILLSKYSLQDDIIVGSPIVGRDNTKLLNIIGMFVNTLPLRIKIDQNNTFREFLKTVKDTCLEAFKNQNYPFNELVNDLNIPRDSSRNPLFDVMFIYQNEGNKDVSLKNIQGEYFLPDTKTSKFDLSLEIVPKNDELYLNFEYCTALFKEDFIENLSHHYINIIKTIIETLDIPISRITMLSDEEKNTILNEFNNTTTNYPKNSNIITLFEEQVEKHSKDIAVVFEDQKLTYEELNKKANQLAHVISNHGINEGDIIALLMDKSLEMIVSILAVLKANCAFLPIDVSYPKERIDYMLKDSNSKLLITTDKSLNSIDYAIKIINIDINKAAIFDNEYINNYLKSYNSENLAYIMYTSGSTGTPKGVMIKQKSIIRLVKDSNFIKYNSHEHILQSGSIVFDASTFEIWSALLNGFELYIIKKEELLNSDSLQNYLLKNKITILWLTAPLFNQLIEENPHMFNTVNYLLTGGDVLSPKHINMARIANPNLKIINGYGPTENTTFSSCFTIDQDYDNNIPIGYPISNSTCYVCSSTGELVPTGVPGELYVGGDGLAIGYLNNPNLTNEKFINFPYTNTKVYKTGDLVRWLPNGCLEFLGRIDSQIKIRGFRVELNEINLRISKFMGIKECTTVLQEIKNEKTICCYYVSKENIDLNVLKNYLKTFLPSYMIPSYFVQLDKLPINTNGKVDKKSLPTNFNKKSSSLRLEKPKNETEDIILNVYKKILNIDEISTNDDFFEIGGDSLSAMKLQVELLANNLNITYADIFKYSSIKSLAKFVNSARDKEKQEYLNYKKYDKLLKNNSIDNINKIDDIKPCSIGNVLLTGFTGFLGAHVLDSFIKNTDTNIYCLIRGKNNLSALDRLKNILHFYFEDKYDKYIGNRINLVEGDITKDNIGLSSTEYEFLGSNINTVIHCAALVKHYGTFKEFENINILGTKRIIDFCTKFNLKLLHVSTISVSGNAFAEDSYVENNFTEDVNYSETNFYIGQNLENLYVKSKFIAEKLVLDAINTGLEASILRMGNLTSRFSEGKFQQNHFENAFVNRFKSILQIKYAPDYLLSGYVEFTPIDYCGDAIIKIASHFNPKFTVFHLLNEKIVTIDRLLSIFKELNIDINIVSSEKFKEIINDLLHDSTKKMYLEGIINDFNKDTELVYESPVKIKSEFTNTFLNKIGFSWPYIDKNYIYNYLKYLADIGYFNINLD